MAKVHILPPEIVSKIAAGEVIERPASVIKELMENSLDAGTDSIEIDLKNAGKTSINIKDTGSGIESGDMEKIFQRHSTSKIERLDDLYAIQSLGFRGEALYSIASISDITLYSKAAAGDTGWEIHLRGGEILNKRPSSIAKGTEIEVNELFFNTPARRKFLKSDTAEMNQILNTFIPYALIYNNCRFILRHNGRELFNLKGQETFKDRIAEALNLNTDHILEEYREFPEEDVKIRIVLGDINIQRHRRDMQFLFINNRPVKNASLSYNINKVYRLIFPPEVNPFFAVHIDLRASDVDVNMHPTKREVKLKDEYGLTAILRPCCEQLLMTEGKARQVSSGGFEVPDASLQNDIATPPATLKTVRDDFQSQYLLFDSEHNVAVDEDLTKEASLGSDTKENLKLRLSNSRYIGAFLRKYLFFESGNKLLLIDQHAAQERITYERLKKQIDAGSIEVQRLLAPVTITLAPQEMLRWEELHEEIELIGFSTTQWGDHAIAVHSHPQLISNIEAAMRELLSGETIERCDKETLARRACRKSVMAGDKMSSQESGHLRDNLLMCEDPFTCPHGRPTVVEIPESFLNKQFLR